MLFHLMGKIFYNKRSFASFYMFTNSNPESLQGRVIRTPGLLLQKTLHETVRLISR